MEEIVSVFRYSNTNMIYIDFIYKYCEDFYLKDDKIEFPQTKYRLKMIYVSYRLHN